MKFIIRYKHFNVSTGQGVVLERSIYGDFVFAEAMYKHGYINAGGKLFSF